MAAAPAYVLHAPDFEYRHADELSVSRQMDSRGGRSVGDLGGRLPDTCDPRDGGAGQEAHGLTGTRRATYPAAIAGTLIDHGLPVGGAVPQCAELADAHA